MYNSGKIRLPVIIIGLCVVVYFMVTLWILEKKTPVALSDNIVASTTNSGTTTTISNSQNPSNPIPTPIKIDTTPYIPTTMDVGHAVGISAGGGLSQMSFSDMNKYLDQMQTLGVKWVRFDVEWGLVQYSSPNKYNWSNFDNLINAINSHGMMGLGILLFTPEWARDPACTGGAKCPPRDPAQFAKFAADVANRYKDKGIHYWEIWNEPNNYDFWATKTDCVAYTALLIKTYTAIKQVDSEAFVITGGLAPAATDKHNISPLDFVQCIYKNGGKNYFDALAHHPYTFPYLPSKSNDNAWGQMSKNNTNMRSIMNKNGDKNKKIWMTEYGAPTDGPDSHWFVSEGRQSEMITSAIDLYRTYDWAGPIFFYSLKDNGTAKNTSENFFGLIRFDGSFKPGYTTLKNIISEKL